MTSLERPASDGRREEQASAWAPFEAHRARSLPVTTAAAILLALLLAATVALGPSGAGVRLADVWASIADHLPLLRLLPHAHPGPVADSLVWEIRFPRALSAAMIGALLAYAGVAFQGLLMNPLADPYTTGVSAGAAVGAAAAEVMGLAGLWLGFATMGVAFAAALIAVAAVYLLARVSGRVSAQTFLLAGVVVGTFLWSMIPLLLVLSGRGDDMRHILFYLIGSVEGADWARAALLAPFLLLIAVSLRIWSRDLNLVTFGEETAAHLGVDVERFKVRVLLAGSLATATAVSVGGIIGFVGLVVPHLARRIVGPDHRAMMPLAGLFGAVLMLLADTIARVPLGDQMPVGVITSLVGAPVFCYLLRKRQATAW